MKIVTVANQKGGVSKSTLAAHLAYAALDRDMKVLLVDMDAQANLTLTFTGGESTKSALSASDLFKPDTADGQPYKLDDGLSLIAPDHELLAVDRSENEVIGLPANALKRFSKDFDLCVIDTPPLLGVRLMASLAAADAVVTPVAMGLYELSGLSDLLQTIHIVRTQGINSRLVHLGILPANINSKSKVELEQLAELRRTYGNAILPQTLHTYAAVKRAMNQRVPVWFATKGQSHLKAAQEWQAATAEILGRI